ncbi:MAG: DUF2163 domain-containing protein [Pseudomonadota bacterium]
MRVLAPALQTALDSGASTLARCWRITRRDGVVLGFTDHDLALSFDGVSYEPGTGLTSSAVEAGTGLAADSHAVEGALSSDQITAEDIALGLFSGAEVALFTVDWTNVEARTLLSRGQIGEIRRGNIAFEAEIVGLSERLNQPQGRAFIHTSTQAGPSGNCGVDLSDPAYRGTGTLTTGSEAVRLIATGLSAYAEGWFTGGNLRWISGRNTGVQGPVKAHLVAADEAIIELWLTPPLQIGEGDQFELTVNCNVTARVWKERFGSLEDFRGFPHIPGDDVAASYPQTGGAHDGGSLFRN